MLVVPDPEAERYLAIDRFDLGQATMAMMIAAADLGIGSGHSSPGDQDAARRILGVPEGHTCVAMIGLGYPVDCLLVLDPQPGSAGVRSCRAPLQGGESRVRASIERR